MMREGSIQLEVERNQLAWQMFEDLRHHHASHTIASINHHLERLDLADIYE